METLKPISFKTRNKTKKNDHPKPYHHSLLHLNTIVRKHACKYKYI